MNHPNANNASYNTSSNTFNSGYDYVGRTFDGINPLNSNSGQNPNFMDGSLDGASAANKRKPRYGGPGQDQGAFNQATQAAQFQNQPQMTYNSLGGLNIDNGASGLINGFSGPGAPRDLSGNIIGGIPNLHDFAAYAAAAAAAGSGPSNSPTATFGGVPMLPQTSHPGSSSSAMGTPASLQQTSPILHTGFGLVGPGFSAGASPSSLQNSPFASSQGPSHHAQQSPNGMAAAAAAMMAAQNGGIPPNTNSPSHAALSGLSGFSASENDPNAGPSGSLGNMNGQQDGASGAVGPGPFGSPALNQAAFAAAAGLGVGNMFGIGGFTLPGNLHFVPSAQTVGGLGMSLPMTSPNMSQQLSDMGSGSQQQPPVVRTVYVGNLPGDASVDELLSLVRYGPIENVKIIPDKSCAFISFLEPNAAAAFHSDACLRKLTLHGQELKIGWGKPTTIPAPVLQACQQHGATRNVYLGNLDESYTEQSLRDELSKFGHIDQVKIVRDKNIGFVHFLSIATAIKVVQELPKEPEWQGRRVNYGKDRCAYVPRNQHQQQQHNQMAATMAAQVASQVTGFPSPFNPMSPAMPMSPMMSPLGFQGGFVDPNVQVGNRTVYLGNLHPETTCEDICNTIRGGILQEIRHIPDKHICFVTFVLAESAVALYQHAISSGITVKNRRLKIGWGKPSGPCPPGIAAIVATGGSRNVYLGNIDDFDTYTVEKIKSDLGQYGDIEQVNLLQEKSCAFTNFTKISSAVKAIEALKQHEEYSKFKIAYGKDRVGNMARSSVLRRSQSGQGHQNHHHNNTNPRSPPAQFSGSPQVSTETPAQFAEVSAPSNGATTADGTVTPQTEAVASAAAAVATAESKH